MHNYFDSFFAIRDFHPVKTKFSSPQKKTLEWLAKAHIAAEALKQNKSIDSVEIEKFSEELQKRLKHVGCSEEQIEKRGHCISDFLHHDWDAMEIYCLNEKTSGASLDKRLKVFDDITSGIFEKIYDENKDAPDDLIHVSCTGYTAPSSAQRLVSTKKWEETTVTHAYHMGCYGSIPALRMGCGFLAFEKKNRADIVHTEVCSLHTNPSLHSSDKLVSQSLFADGFIKYSISRENKTPYLKILALHEEIIDSSLDSMTWNPASWGFDLFIAKEIPVLIKRNIFSFLENLCKKTNLTFKLLRKQALFAIHPGGPKIINQLQNILDLEDEQVKHTRKILRQFGNMSSATLPYIWNEMLNDSTIENNTYIVSLAFGPGLTICGNILQKVS